MSSVYDKTDSTANPGCFKNPGLEVEFVASNVEARFATLLDDLADNRWARKSGIRVEATRHGCGVPPTTDFQIHAADQLADLLVNSRTSDLSGAGTKSPKQPEAKAMPGHHGVRLDDEQGIRPIGPPTAESRPKHSI